MKRELKISVACVLALTLAACAPTWVKPGASQNDFSKDRYDCLQQSQQRVSGAYVNAYGGASSNKVITNDQLFGACMNSKGWTLQSQSQVEKTAAQNRQVSESANYKYQEIIERSKTTCTDKSFEAFYNKTPCAPIDTTLSQLSDPTKINASQKKALDALTPVLQQNNRDLASWYRTYGGGSGAKRAQILELIFDKAEANRLKLYTGKITWGEFNKTRKEISSEHKSRMTEVNQ